MTALSNETLDELLAAARKATPGEWRRATGTANYRIYGQFREVAVAYQVRHHSKAGDLLVEADGRANAEFIALANPATLTALITELQSYRSEGWQPAAYLKDVGGWSSDRVWDECLVPASKYDPGAFPVYSAPLYPSTERGETIEGADGDALRASPPKPSEAMVEAAAREFLLHKGETPWRTTRGGVELWENYAPAMRAALTAALSGGAK